nr:hypothetical protein [Corynebacterium lactis]
MHVSKNSVSARALAALAAAGSLVFIAACGGNPEPSAPVTAPPATNPSDPAAPPSSDFLGTTTLPQALRDGVPQPVSERITSCVESDLAMPIIFGSENFHGFTCIMGTTSGSAAMLTTAQDPAAVERMSAAAESVDQYAPRDIPGKRAFSGISRGTPFLMVLDEGQGIYQEYAFGNTAPEQAQPEIDSIVSAYQG